jgi:cardiolipin synthase
MTKKNNTSLNKSPKVAKETFPEVDKSDKRRIKTIKTHINDKISEDGATNDIITIPNIISLVRLILVPVAAVFILMQWDYFALLTIVVCGVSDFLDGFLARRLGQVTRLGRALDPVADRFLIFITLITFSCRSLVPLWFVLAILVRELVLMFMYSALVVNQRQPVPVKFIGKVGAAGLMICMPLLLLTSSPEISAGICAAPGSYGLVVSGGCLTSISGVAEIVAFLLCACLIIYWIVGVLYFKDALKSLRSLKKSPHSWLLLTISTATTIFIALAAVVLIFILSPETNEWFLL